MPSDLDPLEADIRDSLENGPLTLKSVQSQYKMWTRLAGLARM
jgi:hypothetical protein